MPGNKDRLSEPAGENIGLIPCRERPAAVCPARTADRARLSGRYLCAGRFSRERAVRDRLWVAPAPPPLRARRWEPGIVYSTLPML